MNYNAIHKSTPLFTLLNESLPNYPHIGTVTPLYYLKQVNKTPLPRNQELLGYFYPKPRTLTPFKRLSGLFLPPYGLFFWKRVTYVNTRVKNPPINKVVKTAFW